MLEQARTDALPTEVPVLIAGGGPVGLTMAALLARQGVRALLVERHPGTAIHPRARGINIRTMEIFRGLGIEGQIREAGAPLAKNRYMLWVETLAGAEVRRAPLGGFQSADRVAAVSPADWAACAQDELEPILVTEARRRGADVRFGTELLSFTQDASGISALVRDRESGAEQTVRARYLVGSDGVRSPVRAALGVGSQGPGTLAHDISVYFRADLRDLVEDRWFVLCFVEDPAIRGLLLSVNNTDRWTFQVPYEPSETPVATYTEERCIELVREAIGRPDLPVEILAIIPWEPSACVADTFQVGRVLLAGDAAHVVPPAGAFGMNVGIQDAHNLAWKLAAVVNGTAGPSLLETYGGERRPVAQMMVEQTVESASRQFTHATPGRTILQSSEQSSELPTRPPEQVERPIDQPVDDLGVMLGYWYASSAVVDPPRPALTLAEIERTGLALDGRPGTRAPHAWLRSDGRRLSTLDLFEGRLTLLAGPKGASWLDALTIATSERRLDAKGCLVGEDFDPLDGVPAFCDAFGIGEAGAALIRPDGFVGWRSAPRERPSPTQLGRALDLILGHA